ncbi:hypothetical protein PUNSTDRAFT_146054 [Punctularia strigosozonata HHB-11173 SS5]|uniref:G protein-coupled receptor 89 n=1 Tax=Punctularia strigosozonata (strain HHB-11173) TaxID=741275 RepID=R7S4K2_PUNST|nr:uncharacterized protein PUNSTDRAFT_146054 [Punctularia strigosozonata HHB-11173 SS5]EIN05158.1 hypothetical protein PUNSTDRAFT_146054 [Punctularia strigosozonata HHB-11173 SS5]
MAQALTTVAWQTSLLTFTLRIPLFLVCRHVLLRSLEHDLRGMASESPDSKPGEHAHSPMASTSMLDLELDSLPQPLSTTRDSRSFLGSRSRPLHSKLARGCFAASFSESCTLFALLMMQGIEFMDARTRLVNWRISLLVLLLNILVFAPLSLSLSLMTRSSSDAQRKRPTPSRIGLAFTPVIVCLFLLSYIPLPETLSISTSEFLTTALARLVVLGTVILGLLSGFGATSNAWAFLPALARVKRDTPTEEDVKAATSALERIRDDLAQRRADKARTEEPQSESSWLSRVVPTLRGDDKMTMEMRGLETLEHQMSRNLDQLRQRRVDAAFSNTITGRLFGWGGRAFVIYCIYRTISCLVNVLLPIRTRSSSSSTDVTARLLHAAISVLPFTKNISMDSATAISRQISLVLVGFMIISSIRLVLRGVVRTLRMISSSGTKAGSASQIRSMGTSFMVLMLAQVMGIYLLATIVQMRTSFPPPATQPQASAPARDFNVFSTIPEFQVFGALFDWSFVLSALGSGVARWLDEKVNGAD